MPPTRSSGPAFDAERWIRALRLSPHPEGGHFREVWRAEGSVDPSALPPRFATPRALGTSIYYLLRAGERSLLHRLHADEVWHLYDGGPLTLHVFERDNAYHPRVLGLDVAAGEAPQQVVPHGCWFGAELAEGANGALVGCTVAPGFEFGDLEFASRDALLVQHPEHAALVTRLTEA